jgi:Fe-S-cluster containining protein
VLEEQIKVSGKLIAISSEESFRFECSPGVACFNACCRDLNQFLYPYDILRLRKRLGLSSGEFLNRYTSQHLGPASGLPIVSLTSADARRLTCPFVTAEGCSVYPDRPSSCRIYPLVRAISRNRTTHEISEHFMLLKEPQCLGFGEPKKQTVRQWINDQEVGTDNLINDKLMEIISLKRQRLPGPLDLKSRGLVYRALYDLDSFKNQIFTKNFLNTFEVDPEKLAAARTDDKVLLEVGIEWVKQVVFKE